jgi:hypothetical protein
MFAWVKANGGPLALVAFGLGLGGFTSRTGGLILIGIGLMWFLIQGVLNMAKKRRRRPSVLGTPSREQPPPPPRFDVDLGEGAVYLGGDEDAHAEDVHAEDIETSTNPDGSRNFSIGYFHLGFLGRREKSSPDEDEEA